MWLRRCAATLRVCAAPEPWRCVLCARAYLEPPTRGLALPSTAEDVPRCLVCGLRLALGPAVGGALEAPSLVLGPPAPVVPRVP
ncbi:MAG: hypothetical protein J3K34DRAFT_419627 [Monoraphidium minutum]|nr:MAG: hypothetical protein J3K34DRAFT_419627 [Monoraphidium minutum]